MAYTGDWADGNSVEDVLSRIREAVEDVLPGLPISEEPGNGCINVRFPTAAGSDYSFIAYIDEDFSDFGLSASLSDEGQRDRYFWHVPYERWDFDTFDEQFLEFLNLLLAVLRNPTRIREDKGLILRGYTLEYQVNDEWSEVPGSSATRFGFKFPDMRQDGALFSARPYEG